MSTDTGRFTEEVLDPSPMLALIVATHLHIEGWLTRWLAAELPNPSPVLKNLRPTFRQKVLVGWGCGIVPEATAQVLLGLNTLRNKYAHRVGFQPSVDEIQEFLSEFWKPPIHYGPNLNPTDPEHELSCALAGLAGGIKREVLLSEGLDESAILKLLKDELSAKERTADPDCSWE